MSGGPRFYGFTGVHDAINCYVSRNPARTRPPHLPDLSADHDRPQDVTDRTDVQLDAPSEWNWVRARSVIFKVLTRLPSRAKAMIWAEWYLLPRERNTKEDFAQKLAQKYHVSRRSVYNHLHEVTELVERELYLDGLIPDPRGEKDDAEEEARRRDRSGWEVVEVKRPSVPQDSRD